MKIKCKYCGYEWNYNGRMTLYATCPNCKRSIKLQGEEQKETSVPSNDEEKENDPNK